MTYSVVARDLESGLMGIAVQSHHLSVGAHVIAAEPGVGVIAAQSYAHRGWALAGIDFLRDGSNPAETLDFLRSADPRGVGRAQVAILSPNAEPAAHTGVACIPEAGHLLSKHWSTQANMVRSARVWEAMAEATAAQGPLVDRLLNALDAAETAGGDWRGRQSAALKVVSTEREVTEPVIDLRVDDHPDPLGELRRLDGLRRAARVMTEAFDAARAGDVARAVEMLEHTQEVCGPKNLEPSFWASVLLARAGRIDDAADRMPAGADDRWIELMRRLPQARLLEPDIAHKLIEQVEGQ